ncbi:class I SAM-dependent methyltransferase [Methylolobus aquaticus]
MAKPEMMEYDYYVEWKGWDGSIFGKYDSTQALYFRKELKCCEIDNLSGLRVLEIGFGTGSFAGWAKDEGAIYRGLEAIEGLVHAAKQRGFSVALISANLDGFIPQESQDLVIAFDVFEHMPLPELEAALKRIHDWLRPGGRLIFRVPSGDSPFARAIQYGDLTHRVVLGSSAIRQLALRVNLSIVQVRAPTLPVFGLGAFRLARRLFIVSGQWLVSRLIQILFHENIRTIISPNMLVVMCKGEKDRVS